jgi:uncharacterized membrane protein
VEQKKGGFKMKKILIATITVFLTVMVANVQAAQVTFNPGSVALTVEAGKSAVANLTVTANSDVPYEIFLRVGDIVVQGNMPHNWLVPAEAELLGRRGNSSSSMKLEVRVPAGTNSGTYTATLPPSILPTTTVPVTNDNIAIQVKVQPQRKCAGAPDFENVEVSPNDIWAPKTEEVAVTVSGTTVVTPGCKVTGTYSLQSNDGLKEGKFTIEPDGKFSVKINGKFSKKGTDKNGKDANVYNGLLTLTDEASSWRTKKFFVKVAHDRRK